MRGIVGDLRHALRLYLRTPVSSAIAVIVLAVGMAFVGAFLSMYVDLVLRPHAGFEQSGRIVTLGQNDGTRLTGLPYSLIERINDEMPALERVVGVQSRTQVAGDPPVQTSTEFVTRGFTDGLKPRVQLGRGFEDAEHDPEAERVVIVSHRYWQDVLGGSPDIVDTTIEIAIRPATTRIGPDGRPEPQAEQVEDYRIVGVMAPEMTGLIRNSVTYWLPYERAAPDVYGDLERTRAMTLSSFGRIASGISVNGLTEQLNARYLPEATEFRLQPGFRLDAIGGIVRNMNQQRDSERQLRLFLVGSILLALVAAANVSLYLLARAPGRRRELAIRLAVGAPVRRLARQLASESALLVVVAAALGLAFSVWLGGFLRGLAFLRQAAFNNVTLLDWRMIVLVGAFLALVALLVSLAPVLGIRRLGIAASSRQVAARASIAQRIAGTAQIAIAGTMAGAAVAFGWYLGGMVFGYPGYETRNLHVVRVTPASIESSLRSGGFISLDNVVVEVGRLRDEVEAIAGVMAVSVGSPIPGASINASRIGMTDPLDPTRQLQAQVGSIDDEFIGMLGLRLVSGRGPEPDETAVAVINQTLARNFFGREDVVGESLPFSMAGVQRVEVIGVIEDLPFGHPAEDPEPILLIAGNTGFFLGFELLVSSPLASSELQRRLDGIVAEGKVEVVINMVQPLTRLRSGLIDADRARALLTIGTAALVVLLAGFGFYGTQRFLVTAGRREYAIRASLGAGPKAMGRLVIRRGLLLGAPGLALGVLLAFITVAWLRDPFVSREVSPMVVTLAVAAGLVLLLMFASLGPARLARRTQPAPLLRED